MKSKFLLPVLIVCALITTQAYSQAQLALGLKAGVNMANLDVNSDVEANYNNRTGYHGGAFLLIKLAKVGIQPEILFSKQGSNFKFNGQDYESNFDYINVPVMIKLYTVMGINLQIGPQISFLSSAGGDAIDKSANGGTGGTITASEDLYKSSDFSANFGVGWDLPFGLTIDARYNLGLSKIQDNPNIDATKNQVIQISLGYKILKFGK
jgi:hypothetical protein